MDELQKEYRSSIYLYNALKNLIAAACYDFLAIDDEVNTDEEFDSMIANLQYATDCLLQSLLYEISIVDGNIHDNEQVYCEQLLDNNVLFSEVVDVDDWVMAARRDLGAYTLVCNGLSIKAEDPGYIEGYNTFISNNPVIKASIKLAVTGICFNLASTDGNFEDAEGERVQILVDRYFGE